MISCFHSCKMHKELEYSLKKKLKIKISFASKISIYAKFFGGQPQEYFIYVYYIDTWHFAFDILIEIIWNYENIVRNYKH